MAENVLLRWDGLVKLCDFNFARTTLPRWGAPVEHLVTRHCRAPEVLLPVSAANWLELSVSFICCKN